MAQWVKFERKDGSPVLANMDQIVAIIPDGRPELVLIKYGVEYQTVKGDVDSIALALGAETFVP